MANPLDQFDEWLRTDFVETNTWLEEAYFAERVDVIRGREDLELLKQKLLRQGGALMDGLAAMPALPADDRACYRLLGMVGYYLAACQRHEAGLSDAEGGRQAAWSVALRLGGSLGVAPRYVFAHQSLFNDAIAGRFRTFTTLADEEIFIRFNALSVLAYRRAANALRGVADLGISNPVAGYLLDEATTALQDVLRFNQELGSQLSVERFFFNIRPYFKTYRVGPVEYRGANAGDFADINEIDVTLGLCRTDDLFYQSIVYEKLGYVPPQDRHILQGLDCRPSLLDAFCRELDSHGATTEWKDNAARFLQVCKAHGAAYAYHHHRLVKLYLEEPARTASTAHSAGITSSGPPLDEAIAVLHRLLDLRIARDRPGTWSAAQAIARLQHAIKQDDITPPPRGGSERLDETVSRFLQRKSPIQEP